MLNREAICTFFYARVTFHWCFPTQKLGLCTLQSLLAPHSPCNFYSLHYLLYPGLAHFIQSLSSPCTQILSLPCWNRCPTTWSSVLRAHPVHPCNITGVQRAVLGTPSVAAAQPQHRMQCLHWWGVGQGAHSCLSQLSHLVDIPTQAKHPNASTSISFITATVKTFCPSSPKSGDRCEAKLKKLEQNRISYWRSSTAALICKT